MTNANNWVQKSHYVYAASEAEDTPLFWMSHAVCIPIVRLVLHSISHLQVGLPVEQAYLSWTVSVCTFLARNKRYLT